MPEDVAVAAPLLTTLTGVWAPFSIRGCWAYIFFYIYFLSIIINDIREAYMYIYWRGRSPSPLQMGRGPKGRFDSSSGGRVVCENFEGSPCKYRGLAERKVSQYNHSV